MTLKKCQKSNGVSRSIVKAKQMLTHAERKIKAVTEFVSENIIG